MRRRGRRALQPPGVTVHLCLTLWGERAAARGCDRRVAGAGSLHRVAPHTDVLPSSLRERRDGKVERRENSAFGKVRHTHPHAVVPGLTPGLHGSHPQSVADGSGGLGGEARDALRYDPHLQTRAPSFPVGSHLLT